MRCGIFGTTLRLLLVTRWTVGNRCTAFTSVRTTTPTVTSRRSSFRSGTGQNDDDALTPGDRDHLRATNGPNGPLHTASPTTSRRDAIRLAVLFSTFVSTTTTTTTPVVDALEFPSLLPKDASDAAVDSSPFVPAKRATAYLVDSTRPPTLVPFRASREAAVLKQIGNGGGTQKTPFLEEAITTNNVMNKAVFGTGTLIGDGLAGLGVELPEIEKTATTRTTKLEGVVEGEEVRKKKRRNEKYDSTFVFLGLDYGDVSGEDVELAKGIIDIIIKPRRRLPTTLALSYAPLSTQPALDAFLLSPPSPPSTQTLLRALTDAGVSPTTLSSQLPLLEFAGARSLPLLACAPEPEDVETVRRSGLQNLSPERRESYVKDSAGFVEWTQEPRNKLYTERSLLKDFVPLPSPPPAAAAGRAGKEGEDSPGGYFAERILVHETVATTLAVHSLPPLPPNSLTLLVAPVADLRFFGGPNGRLPRILRYLNPSTNVDDEATTTVLLNPTAEGTMSRSRFLRLEIGTSPDTLRYQTKVADYLWFSRSPKVNMLPRMMNGF